MTENVWGTETVQGHSHPPKSHWSMEQIACHSTRIVILFASIMCLLTVGLVSADFQAGLDAYEQGNYKVALKEWKPLAESGDSKAQFRLGVMYDNGEGVAQDYGEALKWYRKAAEQGNTTAQFNLGLMYARGEGTLQDDKEAVKWYRKAAEQGNATAQFNLGVMYTNGEGVPQDYKEAVKWYRRAAEQGYASAQLNLGVMYANGEGVVQDYVTAHVWYNLAGIHGDEKAREYRDRIAEKMTPSQIAEAQRRAREWKSKSDD